ncbi:hypothetical protein ACTXIZ_08485 [Psychrobacter celer]|uniref:hypothetical protein n=1 Tax=Psychrobacter celer TaxID=306572 RepID=UPI003FD23470
MLDKALTSIKLKLVFLPFLGSSLLTILLYCVIRWILDIRLNIWPLKNTLWDGVIALILSSAIVFAYMRPKIKLLRFKLFEEKSSNVFYFMMILSLFPTIVTSQAYLSKVSHDTIEVSHVEEVRRYPKQTYFQITTFPVSKQEVKFSIDTRVPSKSKIILRVYLYIALPFLASENIWLGERFSTDIDNNLSEQDQHQQINAFINSKIPEYINSDLSSSDYFEKLKNSDLQAGYLQAIKSTCQQVECEPLILVARAGTLSEAATEELIKAIRFLIIGMAICLAMILRAEVDKTFLKNMKKKSY